MLAGSCAVMLATSAGAEAFNRSSEIRSDQIAAATGELRAIPAASADGRDEYASKLEGQLADATTKGIEVAALQQQFADILFAGNGETTQDGAPGAAFQLSVEHRRLLAPYFVDKALLAEDALAYAPGSVLPFSADQIDPRFPWFLDVEPGTDGRTIADPTMSKWELVSVTATGVPGILEATWLNTRPVTGELLAWATASYFTEPAAFGSLTVGQTTISDRSGTSAAKAGA